MISLYGEHSCQRASVPTNLLLAACGPFVWVILTWAAAQGARGVSCKFTCNSSSLSPPVIEEIFSASGPLENHQAAFQPNVWWGGTLEKGRSDFQRAYWCHAICCCPDEKELVFVRVCYRAAVRVQILINNSVSVHQTLASFPAWEFFFFFLSFSKTLLLLLLMK